MSRFLAVQKIALVDGQNASAAPFESVSGDVGVLLADSRFAVQNQHCDIAPLQCLEGHDNAGLFQQACGFAFAPDTRGINEYEFGSVEHDGRVHRIPRSTGNFGDNTAVGLQ